MLHGSANAIALPDLKQFRVMPQSAAMAATVEGGFEAMYAQTVDRALHGTGTETFEAIDLLRKVDPGKYVPEHGAQYPTSRLGQSLQDRKSTRLNSSHLVISYAVFCLTQKN